MLTDIHRAIDALGGHHGIAKALGLSEATVRSWRFRRAFPKRLYLEISDLAKQKRQLLSRDLFRETPDPRNRNGSATQIDAG